MPSVAIEEWSVTQGVRGAAHIVARRSVSVLARVRFDPSSATLKGQASLFRATDSTTVLDQVNIASIRELASTGTEKTLLVAFAPMLPDKLDTPGAYRMRVQFELEGLGSMAGDTRDFNVVAPLDLHLYGVPVTFKRGNGTSVPTDLATMQPGVADAFVLGTYPVSDLPGAIYSVPSSVEAVRVSNQEGAQGILDFFMADGRKLFAELKHIWSGFGTTSEQARHAKVYGWVAEAVASHPGIGQIDGPLAFGTDEEGRFQRTFAHELGHNLSLQHPQDTDPQLIDGIDFDVVNKLVNNPLLNQVRSQWKLATSPDVMVGGVATASAWMRADTHTRLYDSGGRSGADSPGLGGDVANTVVIFGALDTKGRSITDLRPAFTYPWRLEPSGIAKNGRYTVRLTFREPLEVQELRMNALACLEDKASVQVAHGPFTLAVPVPADRQLQSVEIFNEEGALLDGLRENTELTVEFDSPLPGQPLVGEVELIWKVGHSLDPIDVELAYSPDNGQSWTPIGPLFSPDADTTQRYILKTSLLPPSGPRQGRFIVLAASGASTAKHEVGELTITA